MRVRRDQVALGAAAAAVLLAIVVFGASSGVKNEPAPPTPTATPARERDLFGGSLEPGVRYRTREFQPAFSFVVGDTEWLARDTTTAVYVLLERRNRTGQPGGEYPGRSWLAFTRLGFVYDPRSGEPIAAPTHLYAWMRRHPDLEVGPREETRLANLPGYSFTTHVRFRRPAVFPPLCIRLDVPCTAVAPNRFLMNGARMYTWVLRTTGSIPLVIDMIGLRQRDLDEVEVPAMDVLQSLRITGP